MTRWGAEPEDIEALAPGDDGTVWVGDIGDNTADRDTISVDPGAGRAGGQDRRG